MTTERLYKPNNYRDIGLFSIGIFIKLFLLHSFMGISNGLFAVTIKNFLMAIAIYSLASLVKGKRKLVVFFVINFLLSLIFFIDMMYYSHFFTLTPVHSIYQIGQLGPVSNSIFALIKPQYFLFFMDLILLWIYYRKQINNNLSEINRCFKKERIVYLTIFLVLTASTLGMTYKTSKDTEGNYTPYNLGVINYHLYDITSVFKKSSLDTEKVATVVETFNNDSDIKIGFGLAEGRNLIVIQLESIQSFVINKVIDGQMITPNINQLINRDSIYFSRYYEQVGWGNTSDAEFVSHNGFYPSVKTFSYKAYEDNDFFTLPMVLKENGYSTIVFHGNEAGFWNRENIYPSQGLDTFISLEDLEQDELIGIGLSDGSLFKQSMAFLKEGKQPFYSFYITLTSHHPFTMDDKYKGLNIKGIYEDTLLENYLQTVHYLDREIGNFIEMLKKEGLYENSMIVMYGDHQGLDMRNEEANELVSSFLGKTYEEDEMFRVPLIIHIPNSDIHQEVTTAGGQIDFFPTMANLLGIDIGGDRVLGKDLLNIENGFAAKKVHVARGSFIDNEKIFIMSNDGIFLNSKAWKIDTGEPVPIEECREGYERALAEVNLSEYILQNNLISLVREKGLEYIIKYHQ